MKMTEQLSELDSVINSLNEIQLDSIIPRNVRARIDGIISTLKQDMELSIKINKSLNELDEISNDVNLQSYTRTQIWNVMSLLEKL